MSTALNVQGLNKHFANGKHALRDINLSIQKGEMVALIGASGSGKSTLLRHVAGLVVADGGSPSLIEIDGQCIQRNGALSKNIRQVRSQIGFVFQQFNLVDRLPVLVNVLVGLLHRMPVWRSWLRSFNAAERALAVEALGRVGIADCSNQRASTLSGGQQQRAAIARTLVQGAKVVLADEPIASLDPESSRKVMEILARINRDDRCTVVVSLHQVDVVMKISKLSGFKESTNAQLLPIRELDLFGKRTKLEADANMAPAEKQAKLADIDKQLAALKN